jgi:hypothetical protein
MLSVIPKSWQGGAGPMAAALAAANGLVRDGPLFEGVIIDGQVCFLRQAAGREGFRELAKNRSADIIVRQAVILSQGFCRRYQA